MVRKDRNYSSLLSRYQSQVKNTDMTSLFLTDDDTNNCRIAQWEPNEIRTEDLFKMAF